MHNNKMRLRIYSHDAGPGCCSGPAASAVLGSENNNGTGRNVSEATQRKRLRCTVGARKRTTLRNVNADSCTSWLCYDDGDR